MQGLLLRLAALDAGAENAVRVISFFDGLADTVPDLETLLSYAATLAECEVGVMFDRREMDIAALPGKLARSTVPREHTATRRVDTSHVAWIQREGDAHPLDDIVLERFALACATVLRRIERPQEPAFDDPALLELAISPTAATSDRARALRLLGANPTSEVVPLALRGPIDEIDALVASLAEAGVWTRSARLGDLALVLTSAQVEPGVTVPPSTRVGVGHRGPAIDAPTSWKAAYRALRFSTAGSYGTIFAETLGAYDLIARKLPSSEIVGVRDIDVLDSLGADPTTADILHTVEIVIMAGSIREAARRMHLHHNSVSARVARAEKALGYSITEPEGLIRVALALALRRLARSDDVA